MRGGGVNGSVANARANDWRKPVSRYENNTQHDAPNANDFLGGNYLKKEDLDGPMVVTINDVWQETLRGERLPKLVAQFVQFDKPLILNKTNIRVLARVFGTGNTAQWRGEVELYVEQNVEYSGRVVGGIRVRPLPPANASRQPQSRPMTSGHRGPNGYREPDAEYGF